MFRLAVYLPCHQFKRLSKKHIHCSSKSYSNINRSRNQNVIVQSVRSVHKNAKKEKSSHFLLYTLGFTTLSSGAVVMYAKYDPTFRAWLDTTIPGSDSFLKFVLQEEKSYSDATLDYFLSVKDQAITSVYNLVGAGDQSGKTSEKLSSLSTESKISLPAKEMIDTKHSEKQNQENSKGKQITKTKDGDSSILESGKKGKLSDSQSLTVTALEVELSQCKKEVLKAHSDIINIVQEHTNEIYKLVESAIKQNNSKLWSQIKQKTEQKENALKIAEEYALSARKKINNLIDSLNSSKIDGSKDAIAAAKSNVKRVLDDLEKSKKLMESERQKALVSDTYWNKVEEARSHFVEELEVLFPNIKLVNNQIKLGDGDLDLFLFYAFQNILYYQKELAKFETIGQQKLQSALNQIKSGDPKEVAAAIDYEVDKERRKLREELEKKSMELKANVEAEIRLQMKRQAEAHVDHLTEAMALKEREMTRKVAKEIDEKVSLEKEKYKASLAGMVGRMKGLTEAFENRVEQDKHARQSLILWSACQSLLTAVNSWSPDIPWSDQLKPLRTEVDAIVKAGEKDELVEAVVKAIPNEAITRGVYSENALKQRFFNVERTAYRVAIVPEEGAPLVYLFLSFLQSFLIIRAANPIPASELADEPVDISKFDNYDILQRARYWLDRGDLTQTLKYMNLLKGGAKAVARDWIHETRLLLETKQAAETLVFHSTSNGLIYS